MENEHPVSMTARAMKQTLPDRTVVTRDARTVINTATSMFTLYLSTIAHDISTKNKRSTITLKDVLAALHETDFDHFLEPVEQCVADTKAAEARKRARKDALKAGDDDGVEGEDATAGDGHGGASAVVGSGSGGVAASDMEEVTMETDADLDGEQTGIDEDDAAEEEEEEEEKEDEDEDKGKNEGPQEQNGDVDMEEKAVASEEKQGSESEDQQQNVADSPVMEETKNDSA